MTSNFFFNQYFGSFNFAKSQLDHNNNLPWLLVTILHDTVPSLKETLSVVQKLLKVNRVRADRVNKI